MKLRAPRVFRWTEHMNTPEIQAPEFAEFPMAYLPDDELPETVVALLKLCLSDVSPGIRRSAEVYNAWAEQNSDRPSRSDMAPSLDARRGAEGSTGFKGRSLCDLTEPRCEPLAIGFMF